MNSSGLTLLADIIRRAAHRILVVAALGTSEV